VFRALNHEGVAAQCFFELFASGRKLTGESKLMAFTACAVLAKSLEALRRG
jgi:hypothetical protein